MSDGGQHVAVRWSNPIPSGLAASDRVEGMPVRRSDGGKVGTIKRLVIEKRTGKVVYAVMSLGGVLGMGEDHTTLLWGVLTYNTDLDAYELNFEDERLRGAPRRDAAPSGPSADREWEEHVHRYFKAAPYGGADRLAHRLSPSTRVI